MLTCPAPIQLLNAMEVYREILPESYLLILADSDNSSTEAQLSYALRRASRSGKPNVWVDCSHLRELPFSTLRMLARYYRRLREKHIQLVLCHLGGPASQLMAKLPTTACPPVVPSLLDAEHYCRTQHPLPAAAEPTGAEVASSQRLS